mmetsp:Transcript_3422/g.4818  ORF Transcript_3422/g.4818 Transcript_3422/m.4818 type:complete len:83 (+) Transcript_3422:31-279(+)
MSMLRSHCRIFCCSSVSKDSKEDFENFDDELKSVFCECAREVMLANLHGYFVTLELKHFKPRAKSLPSRMIRIMTIKTGSDL